MFVPQVIVNQSFTFRKLQVESCEKQWSVPRDYEDLVRAEWQRLTRDEHRNLWDGNSYRVLNAPRLDARAGNFTLLLGTIRYRYIATFSALHDAHSSMALEPLNHLSTIALIETLDGFYIFGRRTRNGAVELIGGGVQPDELPVSTGADIEQNLYKEIREEIGIRHQDVHQTHGLGIVSSSTSNILIVGRALISLSTSDVEKQFSERVDDEIDRLIFVPRTELREFLLAMSDYRKLIPQLLSHREDSA